MYKITSKQILNSDTVKMSVLAPFVANKAKAGQFIILRPFEASERIPLTVAGADEKTGEVTFIFQTVGKTTSDLNTLGVGDSLRDFVGPLGTPTDISGIKKAAVIAGGLGSAIALPVARAIKESGADVTIISGSRTKELMILTDEMRAASDKLILCTDDGSFGEKGFVTEMLLKEIESGAGFDYAFAVGPLRMMQAVCNVTKPYGIKTVVSMNPIMIDGTGMCGGCRVTVGGKMKFACVDGPDFDGHQVDFEETIARNAAYRDFEAEKKHECRLGK